MKASEPRVHPTAIIEEGAELHDSVLVGPYSIIGAGVELAEGCVVGPHVVLRGPMSVAAGNRFFQFCSIGEISQDLTARDDDGTRVEIGEGNVFREFVTIQRGTLKDQGVTRVGSRNLLMNHVHLAHDCILGDHNILANGASLAGHVEVENHVILGGFTLVHQFCRMGSHCFTGGGSTILKDLPPWVMGDGQPATPRGINKEGLRRRGYSAEQIDEVEAIYRLIYRSGKRLAEAKSELIEQRDGGSEMAATMVAFLERSKRSILR